jgi:hypothetical protein
VAAVNVTDIPSLPRRPPCTTHPIWREDLLDGLWISYWVFGHEVIRISSDDAARGSPMSYVASPHELNEGDNANYAMPFGDAQSDVGDGESSGQLPLAHSSSSSSSSSSSGSSGSGSSRIVRASRESCRRGETIFTIDTRTGAAQVSARHYLIKNNSAAVVEAQVEIMSRDRFALSWVSVSDEMRALRVRVVYRRAQPSTCVPSGSFFGLLWHAMVPGLERPPAA